MKKQSLIYISNWKMAMPYEQAIEFIKSNSHEIQNFFNANTSIIVCPSFVALVPLIQLSRDTVFMGAQDCSAYERGSFTGQVSAKDLSEIGVRYCIVGHSERRTLCHETDSEVAQKVEQLIKVGLTPIICVGETLQEREAGITTIILGDQLLPIFEVLKKHAEKTAIIAYEPIWAIGTGQIPTNQEIEMVFEFIISSAEKHGLKDCLKLVYGGSVNEYNAQKLKKIPLLDGFLIGSASLDFQKLKKIVSC